MNKERRKALTALMARVEAAATELDALREAFEYQQSEEQQYFDDMPESLQSSDKGTGAEDAIGAIDEVLTILDDVGSSLGDIAAHIEEATQ